jgi:hypothetical protein
MDESSYGTTHHDLQVQLVEHLILSVDLHTARWKILGHIGFADRKHTGDNQYPTRRFRSIADGTVSR